MTQFEGLSTVPYHNLIELMKDKSGIYVSRSGALESCLIKI